MKQFKDLEFKPHTTGSGFGYGSYTNTEEEWELAVLFGNKDNWELTYNTPITEDVMGHLSDDEVTDVMLRVQKLK